MSRSKRKIIAEQTLAIIQNGRYENCRGQSVSICDVLNQMKTSTELVRPDDFDAILESVEQKPDRQETLVEVHNETTLAGARALLTEESPVCCLNFASAKNPGGGFLNGSQAQEESLARASGLYASLQEAPGYYEFHRSGGNSLYSHHMIYSPGVPVFRDDSDRLIDQPWHVAMITSPAVNAGALRKNSPELEHEILPVMRERIDRVLAVAAFHGHKRLVLGAWGCGVFRNDPKEIAELFAKSLSDGPSARLFDRVRFSVLDRDRGEPTYEAFRTAFGVGAKT